MSARTALGPPPPPQGPRPALPRPHLSRRGPGRRDAAPRGHTAGRFAPRPAAASPREVPLGTGGAALCYRFGTPARLQETRVASPRRSPEAARGPGCAPGAGAGEGGRPPPPSLPPLPARPPSPRRWSWKGTVARSGWSPPAPPRQQQEAPAAPAMPVPPAPDSALTPPAPPTPLISAPGAVPAGGARRSLGVRSQPIRPR